MAKEYGGLNKMEKLKCNLPKLILEETENVHGLKVI
jgi:hypothetical protein